MAAPIERWRSNGLTAPMVVLVVLPDPSFTRPAVSTYSNVELLVKPFDFEVLLAALERVGANRRRA